MGPDSRRRNSNRLAGHDYATAAAYFVTICVDERLPLFGGIVDGEIVPSIAGLMVESWWGNIERRFPTVVIGASVVMPNHLHGIVMLGAVAGSDTPARDEGDHIGSPLQTAIYDEFIGAARRGRPSGQTDATFSPGPSLPDIVGWFKTMTTNDYGVGVRRHGFPPYQRRLWQRGYYDRVIRNDTDLRRIEAYIHGNPARWADDDLNSDRS